MLVGEKHGQRPAYPTPREEGGREFRTNCWPLIATCLNSCLPPAHHQGQSPHSACAIPMPTLEVCLVVLTSFNLGQ